MTCPATALRTEVMKSSGSCKLSREAATGGRGNRRGLEMEGADLKSCQSGQQQRGFWKPARPDVGLQEGLSGCWVEKSQAGS